MCSYSLLGVVNLRVTLADPKLLKEPIAIISDLVIEAKFIATSNGLELIAMDPANVAMVIFRLLNSSFIEYNVKEKEEIAINLNYLKQVLRRAKSTDTITLETGDGLLHIYLKGRTKRQFSLPLIDIEEEQHEVPKLSFNAEVQTESQMLNDAIGDVDIIGESVTFYVDSEKLSISSSGDMGKASIDIPKDEFTTIKVEEPQKAKYSIEYLKKMIKASKLVDNVKIKFSSEYPLQLEYTSPDSMELIFILAPRMDTE